MANKNHKKRKGVLCIAGGALLLLAALVLLGRNLLEERAAGEAAEQVLEILQATIPGQNTEAQTAHAAPEPEETERPSTEMATVEVDGNAYIGILEVPSLALTLPVMQGWSYANLQIAPCRYVGSVYTGDLVLAGHNYSTHFGALGSLESGAAVKFTDAAGCCYAYTVAEIQVIEPTAIAELLDGTWDLSLFTCTSGGQARIVVRCIREN